MATRQYIGARYVPVFADPVEWDNTRAYDALTMVQHVGETYMSRQAVPIGADLPDTGQGEESNEFWVHMSDWNAQVESYHQEVLQYNGRISTLEDELPSTSFDDTNTVAAAIAGLQDQIGSGFDATDNIAAVIGNGFDATDNIAAVIGNGFDATDTVKKYVDDLAAVLPSSSFDSVNTVEKAIQDIITSDGKETIILGDSWSASPGTVKWPYFYGELSGETLHNYAVSGATISPADAGKGNTSMAPQIPQAIADTSFDHDNVGKIIIMAGVNDNSIWGDDYYHYSTMITALQEYISSLTAEFTNAVIYFVMNYELPVDHIQLYNAKYLIETVEIYCNATAAFGWLSPSMINNQDYTHPTNSGHKKLGHDMFMLTHGGEITRPVVRTTVNPTWSADPSMNDSITFIEHWNNWNDYYCTIQAVMMEGANGVNYTADAVINARTAGLTRAAAMCGSIAELQSGLSTGNVFSNEISRPGFDWTLSFGTTKQGGDGTGRGAWFGMLLDR